MRELRKGRGVGATTARNALATVMLALLALASTLQSARAGSWEMRVCADPNALPFSRMDEAGFENAIATVLAEELDADLSFLWFPQVPSMFQEHFREGNCDLVMGLAEGYDGVTATIAYYRSPYVFIYRADSPFEVSSLDDPVLAELRLGIQTQLSPIHDSLLRRGLTENIVISFGDRGGFADDPDPLAPLIEAVASGEVDVVLPWGAAAGYYAARQEVELEVVPVQPEFDHPFVPMFITMVMGVRPGDDAFRDRLNIAIANRWDEINAILEEYRVPLLPLSRPRSVGDAR